jgi:hypothetical protein
VTAGAGGRPALDSESSAQFTKSAIVLIKRETRAIYHLSRDSEASSSGDWGRAAETETGAGFFYLNRPQPIEKARFQKINASKCKLIY